MKTATLELQLRLPLERFQLEIDFQLQQQVLGIFGPSGSGKTSLLETLAGLRPAANGRIVCGGQVWLDSATNFALPPEARAIGYVPQDHLLFPHLNVAHNLRFGLRSRNEALIQEVSQLLELDPLLHRRITELSGGEKQRVALGRALNTQPKLLLLDEPLAALDGTLRRKILPFLLRIKERFDLPIVLISHNPVELQALCDTVIALREGQIVQAGPALEVLSTPELYAGASATGFENILPVRIRANNEHAALADYGEQPLVLPHTDAKPGQTIRLGLPAHELIVATAPAHGLSARNQIAARISKIEGDAHRKLLTAEVAPDLPPLVAELTHEACTALELKVGQAVYLIFKASALQVYA
jgi:molybdate transport system ATP-binding protein